jgi:putative sterol carrier protein
MLPFEVPPGTTLDTLFREVLPRAHREMLPGGGAAPKDRFVVVQKIVGFETFTLEIAGAEMKVSVGAADRPDFWVLVERANVEFFLSDWLGPKKLVPKRAPKDLVSVSDPRVLKRLALVSAKAELALTDLGGRRVALVAASGAAAKKDIDGDDPDVVLETDASMFMRLVEGTLAPEDALADGYIAVRGKRLIAAQIAFAFAPFYPAG